MKSGFILIDKDKDMTSQKVCSILKKKLNLNKIGHTGTLDPNTTGLLVCGFNDCTKLMPLFNTHDKEYLVTILFGISTDSFDITGNIVSKMEVDFINILKLDEAISFVSKKKTQIPPIYSAIKVDGKKLYQYKRENKEVELKERNVICYNAIRTSDLYYEDLNLCVDIKLNVSSGYYVRSFVNDISLYLNIPCTMKELRRTKCGEFDVMDAIKIDDINDFNFKFLTIEDLTKNLRSITVDDFLYSKILNGLTLDSRNIITEEPFKIYYKNKLIAIYKVVDVNTYKPLMFIK